MMTQMAKAAMVLGLAVACQVFGGAPGAGKSGEEWRERVNTETLKPYEGPVKGERVDRSTMDRKILAGYQGWFTAPGDGLNRGWWHWSKAGEVEKFGPGTARFEMWPDVSELSAEEKYPTPFRHRDGSVAHLYSAYNKATVLRHFKWMEKYGIDGVFVQRFAVETGHETGLRMNNVVLASCREGANVYGRVYGVMYDLSGLQKGQMDRVAEDWKALRAKMKVTEDGAYLRHKGKPVVVVWGLGFDDKRKYTLEEGLNLVQFLKEDGNTVMVGVPTYWREGKLDSVADPMLKEIIKAADLVSPWMVGRFGKIEGVEAFARDVMPGDLKWCRENGVEYMPVCYPGFSWRNMNPKAKFDDIPRLKGEFLWSQYRAYTGAGCTMLYQAMFDEVDEGTAIFKVTSNPPVGAKGEEMFLGYEGLPSDYYLKLVGEGAKRLREGKAMGEKPQ